MRSFPLKCSSLHLTARGHLLPMVAAVLCFSLLCLSAQEKKPADPWPSSETVQAADLAREVANAKGAEAPTIVYVGFRTLYSGGHIPGAVFHGTTSNEQGLAELKKWAEAVPRTTNLVIYCGCCPLEKCPNIRPAYTALHEMGFTKLRVLVLPTSFAADWVGKGYPMEKGN